MAKVAPDEDGKTSPPPPYKEHHVIKVQKDEDVLKEKQQNAPSKYGFFQMFRYSDALDRLLMVLGILLALAQGAGIPLSLYFFYSPILNAMLSYSPCFDKARKAITYINMATKNGTVDRLPPTLKAFMNSSEYTALSNYQSLHSGDGWTLFGEVGPLCGYYALVGVAMFIAGSVHIAAWSIAGQRQIKRIREQLFRAMLSKDAGWYDSKRSGALNNVLFESIRKIEDGITSKVPITVSWLAVGIAGFVIAFVTDWLVTIAICSMVPLVFIVGFLMIRMVRKYSALQSTAYGNAGTIANEVLGNIKTVLAFNRQEYEVERYGKNLGESNRMATIKIISSGSAQGLSSFIINSIAGFAFWWGNSPQVQQAGGNIMQILMCVLMGTNSLANAVANFESIASALSGADEVFTIIDEGSKIDNFSEEGNQIENIKGEVSFHNVAFAYPSRPERTIIKSLSLAVQRGQTVALVGPSGCGKSTTVQMLMRFYDATGGKITIDGVDIRTLSVRWLRRAIGLVSQEPVLFNMSIRDNIRMGALHKSEVSEQEIIEASKLSNAHNFISALPQGYDTMVGERGAQLSGGQKQRIAIARALISNPKILILDEATSALDTQSEKVVQEALDNARVGRTTLVIAHRLSTIRNADLIAVIDGGEVAELGDHNTLLNQGGLYSKLVKSQEVEMEKKTSEDSNVEDTFTHDEIKEMDLGKRIDDSGTPGSRKQDMRRRNSERKVTVDIESGEPREKTKEPGRYQVFTTVLGWGKPELKYTVIAAVVSSIAAALHPGFGILLSEFLGSSCPGSSNGKFEMLIGVIIGLGALQAILMTLEYYLFSVIAERLTTRMRRRILGKFLRMDTGWLDRQENQPSVLTTILATDCIDIQGLSGVRISVNLTMIVILGISIIYSLVLEYRVALALLSLMPFMIVTTILYHKMIIGEKKQETSNDKTAVSAMDALSNIRTVMALGAERHFLDRFSKLYEGVTNTAIKKGIASGPLLSFTMSSILWTGAVTFCLGSWLMQNGESDFTSIIRVYILITFSGMALGRSSSAIPEESKARAAALKLSAILAEKSTVDEDDETGESLAVKKLSENPSLANKGTGRIEFKNVSFSYPTRPTVPILKNISFTVEPGQQVALCGPSGGGKSTIMQLVQRLYDPLEGTVHIDGVDLRQANVRGFRSNIGLVAQEPVLFALSVEENIIYGSKVASEIPSQNAINEACRQANAHEFLQKLPEGLKTQVGERGAQMSGGQKQRIAIARALVRDPTILLLDEATSALDTNSERVVQEALDAATQGRTSLAIAHRLSTIQNCHKILVLANGQVAEQGTHAELMALGGIYYELQQAQNKTVGSSSADLQKNKSQLSWIPENPE